MIFKNNKLQSIKNKSRGFTLLELLLYMGIFSILTLTLFQLFTMVLDTQLESQSTSSVLQDGQYILNRFNYDIRQAKNVSAPPVGTELATLELLINSITYVYTLTNGNITIASTGAQTTDQLKSSNTNASALSFTHISDTKGGNTDTVTISFTLNSNISERGSPQAESFKTTVGIRPKQ